MTSEQIEKFLSTEVKSDSLIRISFKSRNNITGVFIKTADAEDLKLKNFWRIVPGANFEQWKKTHDYNLCRLFNGVEFTKLAVA